MYSTAYNKRGYTLFNLYGFAEHISIRNMTPELYIINCDFEYFYGDFDSLINVETNSYSMT